MAVTAATVNEIQIGAGDVFYKDAAGIWQPVGATMENNVWRIERDYFVPKLNGVFGPLKGTDYLQEERVILEASLPEVSSAVLGLTVPGSVSTTEAVTAAGTPAVGTLADAIIAGQSLAIKVSAVTNLTVGDWIKWGATPFIEYRRVTRVGTALIGGTGVDVDFPFLAPHASGDAFTEVVGGGATVIVGGPDRRLPSASYHDWRLDVPGLDGRMTRFFVFAGIASSNAEYAASDSDAMHPRILIAGRRDASTPQTSAWQIRKELAFT